jgi:Putative Actinobacterial Holin-X, holin superfamily III
MNVPIQPSTAELVGQLSAQTSRLVRDEIRLAQAEFRKSARHAGTGAALGAGAGVLALVAAAALAGAGVAALALVLPVWAAALIVSAVLWTGAGMTALVSWRQLMQVPPPPAQSADSVKDDVTAIREAVHGHQ